MNKIKITKSVEIEVEIPDFPFYIRTETNDLVKVYNEENGNLIGTVITGHDMTIFPSLNVNDIIISGKYVVTTQLSFSERLIYVVNHIYKL